MKKRKEAGVYGDRADVAREGRRGKVVGTGDKADTMTAGWAS